MKNKIKIQVLNDKFKSPIYSSKGASCLDIYSCLDKELVLKPLQRIIVPTGFALHLSPNQEAIIRPRSGLAINNGITLLNSPGTIDADYQGEVKIILINLGEENFTITHHMRIAQMIIVEINHYEVEIIQDPLQKTERYNQGFGSTGLY